MDLNRCRHLLTPTESLGVVLVLTDDVACVFPLAVTVGEGTDESDIGSAAGEKEEEMMEETVMEDVEEALSDTMSIANKRLWQTHCCNTAKVCSCQITACRSHVTNAMLMCCLFVEQRYKPLVKALKDYIREARSMDENLARHKLKTLLAKCEDFKRTVSPRVSALSTYDVAFLRPLTRLFTSHRRRAYGAPAGMQMATPAKQASSRWASWRAS